MATFITPEDYKHRISDKRLLMILESDISLLEDAEDTAIAIIKDALVRYDVDTIFSTTGTDRPKQIIRWVLNLTLYYIYERVPDKLVPERVIKNYDDTYTLLFQIADGKKSTVLPHKSKTDGETGVETKFRWGSSTKRTH